MNFIDTIQGFLNDRWVKRLRSVASFISKLQEMPNLKNIEKVSKMYQKSRAVKNFIDVMEDASTFNITKMNKSGYLFKTISKSKSVFKFLEKNAPWIESGFKKVASWSKSTHPTKMFAQKFGKMLGKTTSFLNIVDIGYKLYQNYQQTKSVGKALVGTFIDFVGDLNVIDGFKYGMVGGPKGAIIGAVVGGVIQVVNFFVPQLKTQFKNAVFHRMGDQNKVETPVAEETFAIDREVLTARIRFYTEMINKLNDCVQLLEKFQKEYYQLTAGATANMTIQQIQNMIKRILHILNEHIAPTLESLKQHQTVSQPIFESAFQIQNYHHTTLSFHKPTLEDTKHQIQKLIHQYERLRKQFYNEQDDVIITEIKNTLHTLYEEKHKLEKLIRNIATLENKKIYV